MAALTIITPTYNRAHTLDRCYRSLCRQTCKDFEWIIVDDGSTDDTQSVIEKFVSDSFPIIKLRKENGGKHTALNASHSHIHGDYVLILDSDDYLTDTAVEESLTAWEKYDNNEEVGVVTFLRGETIDQPLCEAEEYDTPVGFLPSKRRIIISSDCCEVIRTTLFIKYPFPVFQREKFISECALWNRVGIDHKCVYIDSVIYICEYLDEGLTKSGRSLRIRNPLGGMFISNLRMDRRNYIGQRWKYGMLYTCYGFFANMSIRQQIKASNHRLLSALCIPLGFSLYKIWKGRYADTKQ